MAHRTIASTNDASASSSVFVSYQHYDVFINHRGPDVKNTFASSLYSRLVSHRLQVFLDKPELQAGYNITAQIKAAIQVAAVQIAIFSPTYAESNWCLDELLLMVESKAIILPVFYKVKPSEIRWTGKDNDGAYSRALRNHEEKQRYDLQTIQCWRDALHHVANISGFELQKGDGDEEDDEKLLDMVVQSVLKKVPRQLVVAKYPTGLKEKLQDFEETVLSQQEERVEAKVVGIVGIGGIGKTTMAKEFFNYKRSDYNGSSFLLGVRESAARMCLSNLQRKLIKDIKDRDIKIERPEEGVEILKKNLLTCELLIIIDDVDHIDQLEAFLPIKDVLHPKSLILVTSRDKHTLTSAGIVESSIYQLPGLNRAHSQELLCSHAFFQPNPLPGFENLVVDFIKACDGLPLSLKVFGALVCGRDKPYWEEQLNGLHQTLPAEIENSLKISYDSLNQEEQQIFLDIASFAIGKDKDMWIRIWSGSGWKGLVGLRNLVDKCLVEVDDENKIRMHDQLRDLGRNIAYCSRLGARRIPYPVKNIRDLYLWLEQPPSSVITEVRGFRMPRWYTLRDTWAEGFFHSESKSLLRKVFRIRNLQLLEAKRYFVEIILTWVKSPKLIWLCWIDCPYSSLPLWIPMHDLRVLEVTGDEFRRLWQCESQVPTQLRELTINAPLLEFPKSLSDLKHIEKIVVDYGEGAELEILQKEFCDLHSLKYLTLRRCSRLKHLPEGIGNLKNLEHVDLSGCSSLEMLPNSFGNLKNLQHLDLSGCSSLEMLPNSFGNLKNLQHINLSGCSSLGMLPISFGNLTNLQQINLSRCSSLKTFPDYYFGCSTNLRQINLSWCTSLFTLPNLFGNLKNLQHLDLSGCSCLEMLPNSFGNLKNLQHINLSGCSRLHPDVLEILTKFQRIDLSGLSPVTRNVTAAPISTEERLIAALEFHSNVHNNFFLTF